MINLLPEKEKKIVATEYRLRLLAVVLGFCFALSLASILLLVPSFAAALYKQQAANTPEIVLKETAEEQVLNKSLADDKLLFSALQGTTTKAAASDLIQILVNDKQADNTVTRITYELQNDGSFKASINGIAKSRQSLTDFRNRLEHEALIGSVNLPTTNLAKDTNITFDMTINGK
jgi:hypothetical protein